MNENNTPFTSGDDTNQPMQPEQNTTAAQTNNPVNAGMPAASEIPAQEGTPLTPASQEAVFQETKQQPQFSQQAQQGGAPYAQSSQPAVNSAGAPATKVQKKQGTGHFWRGFLGGVVGAAIVAAILLVVLAVFGTFGLFANRGGQTEGSQAGRVIDIEAAGEDVKIAEAVAAKCLPSVASISVTTANGAGVGSGVVYDTSGNIITNNHVIEGAESINVTINDKSYEGTVVGTDAGSDIAVVKIDPGSDTLTPMEVANSDDIVVGEWVMSLGSPFGLDQSVSTGIVSSMYRSTILQGQSGNTIYTNLIQTDAAINPGNSGGALVDKEGKLIGINSTIMSASGSSSGVGFAIPSNLATETANTLIAGKKVEHPTLGVSVTTVTAQIAARNKLPVSQGADIQSVEAGSAAASAGLQQGDIITQVGDSEIASADALTLAVRSHKVGDTVSITYYRGSEKRTVDVTLASDNGVDPQQNNNTNNSQSQINPFGNGNGNSGNGNSGNGNSGNGSNGLDSLEDLLKRLQ